MTAAPKIEIPGMLKLTDEQYNEVPALRSSDLNHLAKSPAHFLEYKRNPPEPTPALIFGNLFHSLALEPELFEKNTVVSPKFDRRTKEGKAAHESWALANHGKNIIEQDQYDQIKGMLAALAAHPSASTLMKDGRAECAFICQDAETGVALKAKPDWMRDGRILVDLKSTEDASFKAFQRSVANFGYHRQAAFYLDVVSNVTGQHYDSFVLIAIEKKPPYAVAVYALDDATIDAGRFEYRRLLKLYAQCMNQNRWPAHSTNIETLNLPAYAWPVEE